VSERRLVSIRRTVSAADLPEYEARWDRVRSAVTSLGANAWRFRSVAAEHLHLEFLEFKGSDDPRAHAAVAAALADLRRLVPDDSAEEWIGGA